jgi:D-alanine-D-alanine ligase
LLAMNQMKIVVLMGGHTSEHEVSLKSGQTALDALSSYKPSSCIIGADLNTWSVNDKTLPTNKAIDYLKSNYDVALLMLHGPFGEDGQIQKLLSEAGMPYTGSNERASKIAISKSETCKISLKHEINTSNCIVLNADNPELVQDKVEAIGFPAVIKPDAAGSSIGISFVDNWDELLEAVRGLEFKRLIVQPKIEGIELTCGIIDIGDNIQALPITQINPKVSDWFDYEAKYSHGGSEELTPAPIDEDLAKNLQEQAIKIHKAIGCSGITRSDFIFDGKNSWLLEINTAPGMTATSLVPQEIKAAGLELGEVLYKLCLHGINRQ